MSLSPSSRHVVELLAVPQTGLLLVRFRGPLRGIGTHYGSHGSVPCMGEKRCAFNHDKHKPVFKAYAPVDQWRESEGRWYPMSLELTGCAEEAIRDTVQPGQIWVFERAEGQKKNRKVLCHFVERTDVVCVDFDPLQAVRRMHHLAENPPSMVNDMEEVLILPPLSEAPPDVQAVLRSIGKAPVPPPRKQTAADIPSIKERIQSSSILNGKASTNGKAH